MRGRRSDNLLERAYLRRIGGVGCTSLILALLIADVFDLDATTGAVSDRRLFLDFGDVGLADG